ncbi:MAG: GH3 auxin-responsive promoter family protein [Coriobacteriales bacterium]|jgi:hypothetical protein|nr:GH3 auxin-responsive promoter family protein [Coriobacteriales bacterium]
MDTQVNPVLNRILSSNRDTDFGRKYHFENIKTTAAFRNIVPITTYDDYAPLVELTTRLGEKDIFTSRPLAGYSLTSGSTGVPRLIPCTQEHIKRYSEQFKALSAKGSSFVLISGMPRNRPYADGTYLDSVMGATIFDYKAKIKDNSHRRKFASGAWTSPLELLFPEELPETNHLRMLFALLDPNVEQIIAPFCWGVLDALLYMEREWEQLLQDMETGSISSKVILSEELREKLNSKIRKSPKRAATLRAIFEAGFDEPVIPRIWPGCKQVLAVGTGSFCIYAQKLRRFTGTIPLCNGFYASSEALIGRAVSNDNDEYLLMSDLGFFEFLPPGGGEPLLAQQLTPGETYEVILTNDSGFYRYRLGDTIRVLRFQGDLPIFTYEYRTNQVFSFFAEEMNEQHVQSAVFALQEKTGILFEDFGFWPEEDQTAYTILVEPVYSQKNHQALQNVALAELEALADTLLGEANPSYAAERSVNHLKPCHVRYVQPQTYLLYRDLESARKRMPNDQAKPVRCVDNIVKEKFFFSMLDKDLHTEEECEYYLSKFRN